MRNNYSFKKGNNPPLFEVFVCLLEPELWDFIYTFSSLFSSSFIFQSSILCINFLLALFGARKANQMIFQMIECYIFSLAVVILLNLRRCLLSFLCLLELVCRGDKILGHAMCWLIHTRSYWQLFVDFLRYGPTCALFVVNYFRIRLK